MSLDPNRIVSIDLIRGFTVLLMIIYHQIWNLVYFGVLDVNLAAARVQVFPRTIGSSFLLLAGMSLYLSYRKRCRRQPFGDIRRAFLIRGLKIFGWGMMVSLATAFLMPNWVVFGILHLIGVSIMAGALLLPYAKWTWIAAVGLFAWAVFGVDIPIHSIWLLPLGITEVYRPMVDYYPVIPWMGMSLIGLSLGRWLYPQGAPAQAKGHASSASLRLLHWAGQRSLPIYLIHQPLLLGATYLVVLAFG